MLRLIVEVAQNSGGAVVFETSVGVIPTPDASVVPTISRLLTLREGIFALVDGDPAGDNYVTALASLAAPPRVVVQWPPAWTVEDLVAWIAAADVGVVANISGRLGVPMATTTELAASLKSDTRPNGLKSNYLAYEEVAFALRDSPACSARANEFLEGLASVGAGGPLGPRFAPDAARGTTNTTIIRFVP